MTAVGSSEQFSYSIVRQEFISIFPVEFTRLWGAVEKAAPGQRGGFRNGCSNGIVYLLLILYRALATVDWICPNLFSSFLITLSIVGVLINKAELLSNIPESAPLFK